MRQLKLELLRLGRDFFHFDSNLGPARFKIFLGSGQRFDWRVLDDPKELPEFRDLALQSAHSALTALLRSRQVAVVVSTTSAGIHRERPIRDVPPKALVRREVAKARRAESRDNSQRKK